MGNIKLITFDLDDTLFNSKKEITHVTLEALNMAAKMGVELIPATGRFWNAVPDNVKALDFVHYAITLNGAEIFDIREHKTLAKFEIPLERAFTIMRVFDELPLIYDCVIDGEGIVKWEFYDRFEDFAIGPWQLEVMRKFRRPVDDVYEFMKTINHGVQKIQPFFIDKTLRLELLRALPVIFPKNIISSSVPNNIEINDINANKGSALKFIANYINIPVSSTMAFGDGLNDTSMIKTAGIGIAMGNACAELKEIADYITSDCNHDGIAEGIKKFCLQ